MTMTNVWSQLLPAALVGVERQSFTTPLVEGEIGAIIRAIENEDAVAAKKLLRIAGVLSICLDAGANGAIAVVHSSIPAVADSHPTVTDTADIALVDWALCDGPLRLQHEVFATFAAIGLRLPHACLPLALDAARRSVVLRPALQGVLGERGQWLAQQNEAWRFASFASGSGEALDVESKWVDGNLEQRIKLLLDERAINSAHARERLMKILPELPARERLELAQTLTINLSAADESLLATLLTDRSRDVRQLAVMLLVRLPDCSHTAQAIARIKPLLQHERKLLRSRWMIDAPVATGDSWKAAGIEVERAKNESLGERGWWLYQLARQVPLNWWNSETGMDANALIKWALASDWAEALIRAWRDILMAEIDTAWADALIGQWPQKILRDAPATLLAKMPFAKRESFLQHDLEQRGATTLSSVLSQTLVACPLNEYFSDKFSALLMKTALEALRDKKLQPDYWLRGQLPELFCAVNSAALSAPINMQSTEDDPPAVVETFYSIEKIVRARLALRALQARHANPADSNLSRSNAT
jgi:Family of unknown function (DUF5691)